MLDTQPAPSYSCRYVSIRSQRDGAIRKWHQPYNERRVSVWNDQVGIVSRYLTRRHPVEIVKIEGTNELFASDIPWGTELRVSGWFLKSPSVWIYSTRYNNMSLVASFEIRVDLDPTQGGI